MALGIVTLVLGILLTVALAATTHAALIGVPVILGGVVMMIVAPMMRARTAKGYAVLRHVDGFRRFIDESEKRRAEFAEKKNLFSEYLPYAVVFGATKKWARAFAGLDDAPDTTSWYVSRGVFDYMVFSAAIDSFTVNTSGTLTSAPASTGGSSGFSGGAFPAAVAVVEEEDPGERTIDGCTGDRVGRYRAGSFAGALLSDMGAEVVRVERTDAVARGSGNTDKVNGRGRRSIGIDLKNPRGVECVLRLVEHADALTEGFRPGVAERLGLGPDVCLARNPRLVFGRMTGWGQDGPLGKVAGHDLNYIALAGALAHFGRAGQKPTPPINLVGDFGGGGMFLAFGVVCGSWKLAPPVRVKSSMPRWSTAPPR